ncbi:restriction endonuclease [Dyella tabacisoli]|uniref:Restriction endonuclease n=1 Tax=Dyella tabacisoli TaxID=2282381 RepID=A0A369UQL7_9GAMM|nr:restriction endonuclease [Dyella tabacisoli]RDD82028.1 restriction endonuclease [Dyella tabacisoli]
MRTFGVNEISGADLIVDAVYEGPRQGGAGDDPLPKLTGVSSGGGFRYRGSVDQLELLVLTSSKSDPDWPDTLDAESGIYTYYGDNKVSGRSLDKTPRFGNEILKRIFEDAESGLQGRKRIPPILVFSKAGKRRDVTFRGIAVPGVNGQGHSEDLVAIWRTSRGERFLNYRAHFTILRSEKVTRNWIDSIIAGRPNANLAPKEWLTWIKTGRAIPLLAPRTIQHRTRDEQLPSTAKDSELLELVRSFFSNDPHSFEACAAELARSMIPSIAALDLTRRSRDGGRDGIGQLRIGLGPSSILVDFALEAKCYALGNAVGVRDISRLISRLRHRQFGILVTTSYVDQQAYKEIKADEHPIVIISGADIVSLLKDRGYSSPEAVRSWLDRSFATTL